MKFDKVVYEKVCKKHGHSLERISTIRETKNKLFAHYWICSKCGYKVEEDLK